MKYLILSICLIGYGTVKAQLMTWNGYDIYDHLVTANHPDGCDPAFVLGLPDDSTWVNLNDNSVMTGFFGSSWFDQLGNDLLLETSYHRDNYIVRLIRAGGSFSAPVFVVESDWIPIADIVWKHIYPVCNEGQATSGRYIFPMDFTAFGLGIGDEVIGIEITFLNTPGVPDLAGVYIIAPPCGELDLGPDEIICAGETIDIDATTPGATYLWQDGSTGPVYPNATPGEYWVQVTIDDCTMSDTIHVFEATTTLDLGEDETLCEGEALILDATTPGATYLWQNNSTQPTFNVTVAGTYSVQITVNNCVFTDAIQIDYLDLPMINLGNDTSLCEGEILQLNAFVPGATYEWQDNSTDPGFEVTFPNEYAVTVTFEGCTISDTITIDYTSLEPVDFGEDLTLCFEETIFLNAFTPGATYEWQDNSSSSGYTVTESGYYWVIVTLENCSVTEDIDVEFAEEIIIDLGEDKILCDSETLLLDATTPGAIYEWQDNSTASTFLVTTSGNYAVTVEVDGCQSADVVSISFVDAINIDLGNDTTLCQGSVLILDVTTPGATYEWQNNSTSATYTVNQPGIYWVNVELNGCSSMDTIVVEYLILTASFLGNDTTLCSGDVLTLDAQNAGANYLWQDNSTNSTLVVDQPGSYWVNVSLNNCSSTDSILIDYNFVGPITLGNDTILCQGSTLHLNANSPGSMLQWQDNSITDSFLVSSPGVYWVTAALGNCSETDTIIISYSSLSSIDLGRDTTLCEGQTIILSVNLPGSSYVWQDNSTSSTFLVDQSGTYWVQASDDQCIVNDTIEVNYLVISSFDLGNDTTICQQESLLLDATYPGATYQWQDNSVSSIMNVTQPGSYWVIVSLGICQARDTINVFYNELVPVYLGNDTTLCQGQSLILDASSTGTSYEWQDGSELAEFLVSISGTYFVTVGLDQCSVTDSITIDYLELSSIMLGNDTILCHGDTLTLYAGAPGAQYQWSDNTTKQNLVIMEPGYYWVLVSLDNCAAADTIHIDYAEPVSVSLGADTTLCPGETLILDVAATDATYLWNDNTTQSMYMVNQSGTYWAIVSVNGCNGGDTIDITYASIISASLGNDTILCSGEKLELDVSQDQATYLWHDDSTNPTFLVSQDGEYSVIVMVDECISKDTILVQYKSPLTFSLGSDIKICEGETWILDAHITDDNVDYLWQDNTSSETLEVTESGLYWLQANDDCGATVDSIIILLEDCSCNIFIPNLFSPNGDHVNDEFMPSSNCVITEYRLSIFDRPGGLLFETNTLGKGWDGTVQGQLAQVGVYAYVLVYAHDGGKQQVIHGNVTVIR